MKKYMLLFYLSLFVLFPKTQFAQWSTVYDDGNYVIYGIEFKDENTVFAAGHSIKIDSGVIIRSLDGGNNWEEVYTQPSYMAGPICFDFINDTLGISGGQDGLLFKTIDGGSTWEMYSNISGTTNINNILFFNDSIGLARYERTADGGYSWVDMDIGNTNDYFQTNDSSVFTSSNSGLFYSSNYGESWLKVDTCQNDGFSSICMATDLFGYATTLNTGKIYKSIDGGWSWFEIKSLPDYEIKQIRFSDENNGYLLMNTKMANYGGSMRVLKTTDGGNSWDFVLFGTDYSFQMAIVNEETILVPTRGGKMYKTTNGGGDAILPRHTEIDWYSKLRYPGSYGHYPYLCINSLSQSYLMGAFNDTVFINDSPAFVNPNPVDRSTFIIRYNNWGSIDWYTVIGKTEAEINGKMGAIDQLNNYYLVYYEVESNGENSTVNLMKYSFEGDSLWAVYLFDTDSSKAKSIKTYYDDHIVILGTFSGTLSYGYNSIHTDNYGIFFLELDQDGDYVNLDLVIETLTPYDFSWINFDINENGAMCISFRCPGPAYIGADTLNPSVYYLTYFDQDLNMVWYNTDFDTIGKTIDNLTFNGNSNVLIEGRDVINNNAYFILYQFNEQGIKTDSTFIESGLAQGNNIVSTTANNRIIVGGSYKDMSLLQEDTLYGFNRWYNSYIYTLEDNLEFVKSSHISGTVVKSIIEHQHNSYIVGVIDDENIIFANDTIIAEWGYFIAKLNSIITPVSEKETHNKLRVFPNPSTGMFSVVLPESDTKNGLMEIYSITGQKVYEVWVSEHNNTLDLSKLNKGIYFLQLSINKRIYTEKIIIQ